MTLIVYDSKGNMLMAQTGDYLKPDGELKYIEYEVPDGYYVKSVDPETGEPVLEEIPKSSEQAQIDALKEQVAALQAASDEQKKITDVIIGATESEVTA